ncbi:Cytochrome c oxidase polypeptide 5B, mitochondrial [Wickerhamiella sorbophila]|uniref:Cytochrome c oxidase polypeptide 5B, mitochondrial n=1 Tax=Wickerhamiella sorbophila TaxID=45607 RepID=A0A2T0FC61_9ASCO|nr:Cytochrome c oxidase polypeptide 5B, mitochondrial [Wickerhamiella sorbophila]PRT52588.1 Cytochrome c oxidase polypeptide 5B, mitochondrial [Wickerhamiella sorbophila]
MYRQVTSISPIARSNLLCAAKQIRLASTVATPISNPTLRGLETRWETMTEGEREDVVAQLAERQRADWKELTPLEKRAAWYVSYGEWGPRRPVHPKGTPIQIFWGALLGIGAAAALFIGYRAIAPPLPKSMAQEWQQASNDMLASHNAEPFQGHNQIQSAPTGISAADLEDDDDE